MIKLNMFMFKVYLLSKLIFEYILTVRTKDITKPINDVTIL